MVGGKIIQSGHGCVWATCNTLVKLIICHQIGLSNVLFRISGEIQLALFMSNTPYTQFIQFSIEILVSVGSATDRHQIAGACWGASAGCGWLTYTIDVNRSCLSIGFPGASHMRPLPQGKRCGGDKSLTLYVYLSQLETRICLNPIWEEKNNYSMKSNRINTIWQFFFIPAFT